MKCSDCEQYFDGVCRDIDNLDIPMSETDDCVFESSLCITCAFAKYIEEEGYSICNNEDCCNYEEDVSPKNEIVTECIDYLEKEEE